MKAVQTVVLTVLHFGYLQRGDFMNYLTRKNILIFLFIIIIVVASKVYNTYNPPKNKNTPSPTTSNVSDNNPVTSENKVDNRPSSSDTVIENDIPFDQLESGIQNKDSIFFDGMEKVYSYLKFNDVEDIKYKLTFFIKNNIDNKTDKCTVDIIDNSQNYLVLSISVANNKLKVNIPKDKPLEFTIDES